MEAKNQSNLPFSERRSMRPVKNRHISKAEADGFYDLSAWIDWLQDDYNKKLAAKHEQYLILKAELDKVEK